MSTASLGPSRPAPQPRKPALKIPMASHHWALASSDLSVLVTEALKACPSPRRNQSYFYFCSTQAQPVAPPPTPVEDLYTPSTPKGRRVTFKEWPENGEESGGSARTSQETDR